MQWSLVVVVLRIHIGTGTGLVEELLSTVVAEVLADRVLELLVLSLEEVNRLLKRLEEELLTNTGALCMLAVAFTVKR